MKKANYEIFTELLFTAIKHALSGYHCKVQGPANKKQEETLARYMYPVLPSFANTGDGLEQLKAIPCR